MKPVTYEQQLERTGKIVFTVKGVSMRPLFRQATDAIMVEKRSPGELKMLDIVLFKRFGREYVLHRIVDRRPDGRYFIAGDNCVSGDIISPKDILGAVTSAQRGGRPIKLSGVRYWLYERLWCKPYKLRFGILKMRNYAAAAARKIKGRRR